MSKDVKDLIGYHFRNPVPPVLFIFSGFFFINSLISSQFIKYSSLTFIYAVAMNFFYYFQEESSFCKKHHFTLQVTLLLVWVIGMFGLMRTGLLFGSPR